MKAADLDIVELLEDVQDIPKGTHCTVVCVFSKPSEAYDLERVSKDGTGTLLYGVKPEQFEIVTRFVDMM